MFWFIVYFGLYFRIFSRWIFSKPFLIGLKIMHYFHLHHNQSCPSSLKKYCNTRTFPYNYKPQIFNKLYLLVSKLPFFIFGPTAAFVLYLYPNKKCHPSFVSDRSTDSKKARDSSFLHSRLPLDTFLGSIDTLYKKMAIHCLPVRTDETGF